jgi:2-keto-3-deoxy-L-rhamnonate aldolase RhmA
MSNSLKQRLAQGDLIVGTFVKTPSPIIVEVLGQSPLDCLCLDAEHVPFDRGSLDLCIMAARAAGMPVLVRVPSASPEHILNALDCGATGVVIPHVRSAEEARAAVRASHYGAGGRGYAGSSRAAGYGTRSITEHRAASAARTVVIAQIEDPEAVEDIDAICRVEGLDAVFVGRVDLTVAYDCDSQDDPRVVAAVDSICSSAKETGRPSGMFLARIGDVGHWQARGASLFLLASDHAFLLDGARRLVEAARSEIQ